MSFEDRTTWTEDNLDILRELNSKCVDLDLHGPPFASNRTYAAPTAANNDLSLQQGRRML